LQIAFQTPVLSIPTTPTASDHCQMCSIVVYCRLQRYRFTALRKQ
jgi:hypothetical protein